MTEPLADEWDVTRETLDWLDGQPPYVPMPQAPCELCGDSERLSDDLPCPACTTGS